MKNEIQLKILHCKELLKQLDDLSTLKILGLEKLKSQINAEQRVWLKMVENISNAKPSHIRNSNVHYLNDVIKIIKAETGVVSIFTPFSDNSSTARVDIVADFGRLWIKVKSSIKSLLSFEIKDSCSTDDDDLIFDSEPDYSKTTIYRQCVALKKLSNSNPVHYIKPVIAIRLISDDSEIIPFKFINVLKQMDVDFKVYSTKDLESNLVTSLNRCFDTIPEILPDKLILDLTTLISLCSNMSHPNSLLQKKFNVQALQYQYDHEQVDPFFSKFLYFCKGKMLFTTLIAAKKLIEIAAVVAGKTEIKRCRMLFPTRYLDGVKDVETVDSEFPFTIDIMHEESIDFDFRVDIPKHVNEISRSIFGSALKIGATAISSNEKAASFYIRMGVSVICHSPRSFCEKRPIDF